jgi:hypothetical protein
MEKQFEIGGPVGPKQILGSPPGSNQDSSSWTLIRESQLNEPMDHSYQPPKFRYNGSNLTLESYQKPSLFGLALEVSTDTFNILGPEITVTQSGFSLDWIFEAKEDMSLLLPRITNLEECMNGLYALLLSESLRSCWKWSGIKERTPEVSLRLRELERAVETISSPESPENIEDSQT